MYTCIYTHQTFHCRGNHIYRILIRRHPLTVAVLEKCMVTQSGTPSEINGASQRLCVLLPASIRQSCINSAILAICQLPMKKMPSLNSSCTKTVSEKVVAAMKRTVKKSSRDIKYSNVHFLRGFLMWTLLSIYLHYNQKFKVASVVTSHVQ